MLTSVARRRVGAMTGPAWLSDFRRRLADFPTTAGRPRGYAHTLRPLPGSFLTFLQFANHRPRAYNQTTLFDGED